MQRCSLVISIVECGWANWFQMKHVREIPVCSAWKKAHIKVGRSMPKKLTLLTSIDWSSLFYGCGGKIKY
ncbi:hypothetical protein BpHYR1_006392 [Brachionus plicatilis]|uniref:Uncharacterized protein n=1 Tax=Brachionus plicatilis TaxID=10195 RepID=A0A3M7R695_BRAPC|nr:hypothetical protein BpHYR1_006392 [Brachionus plicatilis]